MNSIAGRVIAMAGAVVLAAGISACGKPEPASSTTAAISADSRPLGSLPPIECGTANNAAECAEILERLGKDTAVAFGTAGKEPVYTGIPAVEQPPCKNGAANCEPWERMWAQ